MKKLLMVVAAFTLTIPFIAQNVAAQPKKSLDNLKTLLNQEEKAVAKHQQQADDLQNKINQQLKKEIKRQEAEESAKKNASAYKVLFRAFVEIDPVIDKFIYEQYSKNKNFDITDIKWDILTKKLVSEDNGGWSGPGGVTYTTKECSDIKLTLTDNKKKDYTFTLREDEFTCGEESKQRLSKINIAKLKLTNPEEYVKVMTERTAQEKKQAQFPSIARATIKGFIGIEPPVVPAGAYQVSYIDMEEHKSVFEGENSTILGIKTKNKFDTVKVFYIFEDKSGTLFEATVTPDDFIFTIKVRNGDWEMYTYNKKTNQLSEVHKKAYYWMEPVYGPYLNNIASVNSPSAIPAKLHTLVELK